MAGIAPGLDGFLAAQQMGQQRQAQELGVLSRLAQLKQAQEASAQAAEMRPLQMDLLRSQVAERQARAPMLAQEAQDAAARRGALSRLAGLDPSDPQFRTLAATAFPQEFAKSAFREPKTAPVSGLTRLMQERDALPAGDPRRSLYDQAINKQTTSQPAAIVNMPRQESKFQEKVGAEFGDIYTGAIKSEFAAPRTIANYDRLGNLLSQVNTGKFAGTITDLKAAAKAGGIDLNAMGIRDDVAPAQATRQISNMLALELRNPAGGAGMPGAMSDKDREFLQQSIPSIENDPGAIGKMIEYRKTLAKRDQEVGKMARAYRARTGTFNEGFFNELRDFSEKNPLFPQTATPQTGAAGGTGVRRYNPATGRIE